MAAPTFVIRLNNASVITNFIEEAMEHAAVRDHLSKKDERAQDAYISTIKNIKIYEIESAAAPTEVYFRLKDVARLLDIQSSSAAQRVATFDSYEAVQGTFGESKPLWFLSEPGIIKFMYQSRGSIAKVFCRLFSNIIIQVSKNKELFVSMVRHTIEENTSDILEFIDDVNVRLELIKEMYEEEREKNHYLEQQNKIFVEKTYQNECRLYSLQEENALLEQSVDYARHEMTLAKDDDLLSRMMQHYMTPVYLYLLSYDDAVRQFKKVVIPADYAEKYAFSRKYGLTDYHELGFKITTTKSKNPDHQPIKIHYVHGADMFAKLGEDVSQMISIERNVNKTTIYMYGSYELLKCVLDEYKDKFPVSTKPCSQ